MRKFELSSVSSPHPLTGSEARETTLGGGEGGSGEGTYDISD